MRAFVIAGTHSGVGKTTITLGILAALHRRGLKVQPFKVGPDFIDPGHHTAITGVPSRNLDGWMLSQEYNRQNFLRHMTGKEVGVVEGVMGLFDGYDGRSEAGSTAEMAKWLSLPVILVVDASAMARSGAAVVLGFKEFDRDLHLAGVIFNRIGGPGHLRFLEEAMASIPGVTILGGLPAEPDITIPERHLGLITAEEHLLSTERVSRLASFLEKHIDLDRLPALAAEVSPPPPSTSDEPRTTSRVRWGVARDEAFCFYYPENFELLEAAGAELVFFSPLREAHLPPDTRGIYLGGGYPEVHAAQLAANVSLRREVRDFVEKGGVVYAECGGFMYLTEGIRDSHNSFFPTVGVYPIAVRMLPQRKALGYVEVQISRENPLLPFQRVRGHEFHYSELEDEEFSSPGVQRIYEVRKRVGDAPRPEGYLRKRCLASYIHLHFGSNPGFAASLVEAAREVGQDEKGLGSADE